MEITFALGEHGINLLVYQAGPKHLVIADHLLREDDGDTLLKLGKGVQHYYIEKLMRSRDDLRRSLIYYSPFLDFNVLSMGSSDADEDTRVFDISQTAIISRDLARRLMWSIRKIK